MQGVRRNERHSTAESFCNSVGLWNQQLRVLLFGTSSDCGFES
jgi:hypothetical protein